YLLTTIDPRSPLVLDTRELGRRAGSMQEVSLTVPAPAGIGIMSIGVPEGSEVELDVRLESVIDGVLVSGTALVQLTGECSRCLDPISDELEVDLQELYVYGETDSRGRPVAHESVEDDADDEQARLVGDHLDLEPVLRDAVVLDLPLAPVCRDDCPGLCPQCGFRLEDDPEHDHDVIDPRWAALAGLEPTETTDVTTEKEEG
ncbi:MAG TPA: YceD family protein, partial [Candidatus Nanopelagicales bacterium]